MLGQAGLSKDDFSEADTTAFKVCNDAVTVSDYYCQSIVLRPNQNKNMVSVPAPSFFLAKECKQNSTAYHIPALLSNTCVLSHLNTS